MTDLRQRMQNLSDSERLTDFTSTIFRCTDQTLTLGQALATVTADDVIISAKDRGLTVQCTSNCTSASTDGITLQGADSILEHITLEDFKDCVVVKGDDNTVRSVTVSGFDRTGIEIKAAAIGTEVRDSTISDSDAKGMRADGTLDETSTCTSPNDVIYDATPGARACYNAAVYDCVFSDVEVPVDFKNEGRYLVEGGTMTAVSSGQTGSLLGDDGGADETRVRIDGVTIDGFVTGLRLYGDNAEHVVVNGTVINSEKRGVWGAYNSFSTLRDSDVLDNGGQFDSTWPYYGGVATGQHGSGSENPEIDAGTGSEDGDNLVCCNVDDDDDPLQFHEVDGTITTVGNLSCTGVTCN